MKAYLKLEKLIYLAIFSLPLYLVRMQVSFLRTNLWEVLAGVVFLLWLWESRFKLKVKMEEFYTGYRRYFWCGSLLILGFFLSAGSHSQIGASMGIIKSWLIVPLFFVLVIADVFPKEKIKNIFWIYGLSAFSVAIWALVDLSLGKVTYDGRLQAIFNSPNYLAMYLAPGALIFFISLLGQSEKGSAGSVYKKIFSLGGFIIILLALYRTYSYAAWLAVAVGFFLVLILKKSLSPKKMVLLFLIGAALIFLQLGTAKFHDLITLNERSSLASRAMIWQSSWKMVEDNYVLGIGAANFQKTYLEYQKFFPPYLEWAVPHPQNVYLAFWLSGGILALAGFLGLAFFLLRDAWQKKDQNVLGVLVISIMAYVLIHGLFDTTYFKNDLAVIFWLNFLVLKL